MKLSTWIKKQDTRDDHVGDLARDAKIDKGWPRSTGIRTLRAYLGPIAGRRAMEALEQAYKEFQETKELKE